eukprot:COSAG02_NODE_29414_length_569_cov_1.559574_1_plen_46_part_10
MYDLYSMKSGAQFMYVAAARERRMHPARPVFLFPKMASHDVVSGNK